MQVFFKLWKQLIQMLFGRIFWLRKYIYFFHFFLLRVMQAWLFLSGFWTTDRAKSYLSKVPIVWIVFIFLLKYIHISWFQGHLILLDLFSEGIPQYSRFESFYGHYYIWNMLHDFGGNNFLFGSLVNVTNVNIFFIIWRILNISFRDHKLLVTFQGNIWLELVLQWKVLIKMKSCMNLLLNNHGAVHWMIHN